MMSSFTHSSSRPASAHTSRPYAITTFPYSDTQSFTSLSFAVSFESIGTSCSEKTSESVCISCNNEQSSLVTFPTKNNLQDGSHDIQVSSWACTTISCKALYLSFWHSWHIDAEIEHIRQTAADPSSNKNNNNWSERILLRRSPLMEQSTYRTSRQLLITVNFQETFKNCSICMCRAESLITWIHYVHLCDVLDMRRRNTNACIIII